MPEVTSLELSRELTTCLPDTKTEYVWKHYTPCNTEEDLCMEFKEGDWEIEKRNASHDIIGDYYPAWQIHELLEKLPSKIQSKITKQYYKLSIEKGSIKYLVWYYDYRTDDMIKNSGYIDVRLVEALGKLLLWKMKS